VGSVELATETAKKSISFAKETSAKTVNTSIDLLEKKGGLETLAGVKLDELRIDLHAQPDSSMFGIGQNFGAHVSKREKPLEVSLTSHSI
jgi:hypothetical protein